MRCLPSKPISSTMNTFLVICDMGVCPRSLLYRTGLLACGWTGGYCWRSPVLVAFLTFQDTQKTVFPNLCAVEQGHATGIKFCYFGAVRKSTCNSSVPLFLPRCTPEASWWHGSHEIKANLEKWRATVPEFTWTHRGPCILVVLNFVLPQLNLAYPT